MVKPNPRNRLPALPDVLPPASTTGARSAFQKPTLGQAVQLGELYGARSASFLGAQSYAQDKMANATTKTYNRHLEVQADTPRIYPDGISWMIGQYNAEAVVVHGDQLDKHGRARVPPESKSPETA